VRSRPSAVKDPLRKVLPAGKPACGVLLVHRACPCEADTIAAACAARTRGYRTGEHPADWRRHGRAAGYRRNAERIALGADGSAAFVRDLVRGFFEAGKQAGVICHGPWTLVEADVVRGRTLTSWPTLATDIRNAGGTWVDQEVVTDQGLVTSRGPDDLPAFCVKIVEEFAEGKHQARSA
jgi:hypothetical protein